MEQTEKKQGGVSGIVLIILSCLFWSFSGVLSKSLTCHPLTMAGGRAVIATLMLGAVRKDFRLSGSPASLLGAAGVLFTSLLFMYANRLTTSANAIVLQYAMPVFVILFSLLVLRQKPTRLDLICAVCVLGGVLLCFADGLGMGHFWGDALALLSAVSWAMVFFAARMPDTDAMTYTYMGNLASILLLIYLPFDRGFSPAPAQLLMTFAMGVCLGLGYILFSLGMRRGANPIAAAIVANVEPVLNPLWVFLFAGEMPGPWAILGALVVLTSVTVYTVAKKRQDEKKITERN